jgi:hypothetical protein
MLFVVVVIASSTALYLSRLGFASDDWAFPGSLTTHGDLSAPGRSVEHDFAIVHGLAASWAEAWERQQVLLVDIRTRLPRLERHTTIILDGVCPYLGPAIVFESNWDLAGALETLYDDPTVRADTVSANLAVDDDGLATRLYANHTSHYAYSPRVLVFDAHDGAPRPLPDAQASRIWWTTRDEAKCPSGTPGHGTTLFQWNGWYQRLERDHLWG